MLMPKKLLWTDPGKLFKIPDKMRLIVVFAGVGDVHQFVVFIVKQHCQSPLQTNYLPELLWADPHLLLEFSFWLGCNGAGCVAVSFFFV